MLAREVVSDLEGFIESSRDQDVPWRACRVLQPPIRRNIKLAEAPSFGQTIFQYEPGCHGANDYRQLADDVLSGWNTSDTESSTGSESITTEIKEAPCVVTPTETATTDPDRDRVESA